jgi:hypothetical protein
MKVDSLIRRLEDQERQQAEPVDVKLIWYDEEPDPGAEVIQLKWFDEIEKEY